MDLVFTKWVGTGNDFILVDLRKKKKAFSRKHWASLAQKLCRRQEGIGADGLLILEHSPKTDFRMRIFNPDGTEAQMCGNGSRCAAAYVAHSKNGNVQFETLAGLLEAEVKKDTVKVKLTKPFNIRTSIFLDLLGNRFELHTINTGVPHAVLFVEDLDRTDVHYIGREIRFHSYFQPVGTNVNFVKPEGKEEILIRTYERGVERETLSCGTGATASALIAAILKGFSSPVTVLTKGGDRLKIYFKKKGDAIENVYLEGKVACIFEGRVSDV